MKRSVLVLVVASIVSVFAAGCASTGLPQVAFEPRVYPYVPEVAIGTDVAKTEIAK
jgi:hypothetical protein